MHLAQGILLQPGCCLLLQLFDRLVVLQLAKELMMYAVCCSAAVILHSNQMSLYANANCADAKAWCNALCLFVGLNLAVMFVPLILALAIIALL